MAVEAKLRYLRTSPRKVRLVADVIRGLSLKEAEEVLRFTTKRPTKPMLKLLRSAAANAEHNFNLRRENLYISEIRVDGGPILKRFRPRAKGAISPIQKKTSHIFIQLKEYDETKKKEAKGRKQKIEKVKQQEKPKGEGSKEQTREAKIKEVKEEGPKKSKGTKRQVFRRKAI